MARVVKVDLLLEAAKYVRGARGAKDATEDLADGIDDVARSSEEASRSTEDLGGGLDQLARDARRLDTKIAETKQGIRDLAREIASTSDEAKRADLTKKLGLEQRGLRKQIKLRDLVDFNDAEPRAEAVRFGGRLAEAVASGLSRAGGPVSGAISKAFGTLPPQAQVAIGAGIIGAGAAAAPGLAAVVSGAIVGAAGAGGIVGGIAIAARHPQVKASATLTGEVFAETMQRAGVSFVPATLDALGQVRSRIPAIGDDLERAFSATSRFLPGLTDHFLDGAERAVEGFATAAERAGPVIDVIGQIAERTGDVVADTFEGLSQHAGSGARALLLLWDVFEFGIRSVAGTIQMLTAAYGWMEKIGAFLTGDMAKLGQLIAEQDAAKDSSSGLSAGLQDLANSFTQSGGKASTAAVEVESLNAALKRLTNDNLSAEQANIRLEEAINRATEAGKANNAGITANTPKALANRSALLGIVEAANASAEAIYKQTGSQELASEATAHGRQKFIESAIAMGASKREAIALADKLFAIPKNVGSKITVTANTQPAIDNAKSIVARINAMHARISVSARGTTSFGGSAHTGEGYSTGQRWGGVYEHARVGLLREAHIASPVATARYAYAEQATGGEAFIPKYGDPQRSLSILDKAASWYGATLQPRYMAGRAAGGIGGGGGTQRVDVVLSAAPGHDSGIMREIFRGIRVEVKNNGGGSVQTTFGRQG